VLFLQFAQSPVLRSRGHRLLPGSGDREYFQGHIGVLRVASPQRAVTPTLHEFHHTLPYNDLHRHNTDMGLREKKKLKYLLGWGETKSDRTGTDAGGGRADSGDSPARPVPHVVAGGGRDRGGNDDESNSNWKSTTSAAAKLLLRGVKDSAAAFGPLQSVAGALCFILDNCEVCPSSYIRSP